MDRVRPLAMSVSNASYSPSAEAVAGDALSPVQYAEEVSSRVGNGFTPADTSSYKGDRSLHLLAQPAHAPQLITPDELTASIVHEVIQPLTALVVAGERCERLLDRDEPPIDKVRATIAAMISSAGRMSDVVRRLRALTVKGDILRAELNLNEIIEKAVALIKPDVLRNSVSLRLDLSSDLPLVLGDGVQFQQVISNLLANSIQAMASTSDRPRGLLVRSQRLDLNHAGVVVQDNGTGIDPTDMDSLFNPFFTKRADGTGIGLSICRWIIEAHGGLIWASSEGGRGAAFYIALPGVCPGTA